jgi:uncharacterized protein YndB with AHSA1/START domain
MPAAGSADDVLDERELPVPRELVFEVWTVAEHFARAGSPPTESTYRGARWMRVDYLQQESTRWPR